MRGNIFKNTILDIYPSYVKKSILKQVTDDGLVINHQKKSGQMTLNLTDCVDVSDDITLDDKISHMLEQEAILSFVEEYEYKKVYRHFCYFKYDNLQSARIEQLVKENKVKVFDKKAQKPVDEFEKPTIYIVNEQIYIKFSYKLKNDFGNPL